MSVFKKSKFYKNLMTETDPRTLRARRIRKDVKPMQNKDGTVSTHRMSTTQSDGKFYAHPTIFPTKSGEWINPDAKKKWGSFDEAVKRRELFEFGTEKEAQEFALGSWKKKPLTKNKIKIRRK